MKRRNFLINTGFTVGALALSRYSSFADILSQPNTFNIKMISPSLGVFTEKGGTIAFLIPKKGINDGIVIVDSQFPDPAQHLIAALKKKSDLPFNLLMNTHHHADHTSGNFAFNGLVKNVVAHENSLINQKRAILLSSQMTVQQLYPDITFKSEYKHISGTDTIKAYYFGAGHTNGDAMIHFEDQNAVHMGDLVFNKRFPFVDKTAGANIQSWIKVLDQAKAKFGDKTTYIFGHALDPEKITGTIEDVKAFQNYLEKLLQFVGQEIKSGKTKQEILKTTVIPGANDFTGAGIERSLEAAFQELS